MSRFWDKAMEASVRQQVMAETRALLEQGQCPRCGGGIARVDWRDVAGFSLFARILNGATHLRGYLCQAHDDDHAYLMGRSFGKRFVLEV